VRGPRNWRGEPTWTLHDPLRHRFIQIVERDFYLLTAWRQSVAQAVIDQASVESGDHYSLDELEGLLDFLAREELLSADSMGLRTRLAKLDAQRQHSLFQKLLHKYLFFRLPLVRPDAWLDRLYVHARVLMQPWFIALSLLLGAIGLIAIIRNWSMFIHSFSFLFSVSGMLVFVVTLACVKILHELGHALMCKHFGLRVPTMGVAFLVMWPVLYTDATDSWRLDSRHKRAAIAAAGVGVELLLACYAMLFWVILPDGVARSVAFVVATTAWITSALVNLNPLMRFDGYYFLSDMLNVPNLQDRSIALARWQLRGWLFGVREPCPDDLPPRLMRGIMVYAWALLIYRFFLFLGIAFLVYYFFFKALGIFLFLVEIWWFIGRPIYRELKEWPEYLEETSSRRKRLAMAGIGLLLVIVLFPWRTDIQAPAVLTASRQLAVYSSQPARVAELLVRDRQRVE
ncbi:MAG: peptidase M50, partial [Marinobacter sp.]|nr:peptidase M50 [Marinobacter sp.]